MAMDPRIGTLIKGDGKTVYYAFVNGYDQPHTEGTRAEIEIALGIRDPEAPITLRDSVPHEFFNEYMDTPAAKLLDVIVTEKVTDKPWIGKERNVHVWWKLENGKAVGWNESPSKGWSFPVVTIGAPVNNWKKYEVKVTPRVVSYAGNYCDKEYVTEIIAQSHAEAIKLARAERARAEGTGRYVTPCIYSAKRVKE